MPLTHETATALDPQAKAVIDLVIKSGRPPYHHLSPKDARQLFRETRPASTPTPPEIGEVKNLRAEQIPCRVYRPKGVPASTALPALIFFHGGGWVIGDLETHDVLCRQLTAGAGISVVNVDYRLAPEHKFPAAVDDCFAAYRWLREQGRDIGGDASRVAVAGDSAGGNLSAVVSQLATSAGVPVPSCQVLIYPAVDFSLETESHRELEDGHVIPRDRILWYSEQYLRGEPDKADLRASPLRAPKLAGQPPTLIITAGFDPLRDEGHAYADKLREAGVDVVYREYPGQIHAFVSLTKAIPQGMACTLVIAEYLRQRLR